MKKTVLFILSFLFLTSLIFGDVFMTEIADPNNNLNARYIELYNNGLTAVDFTEGSGWRINKYTNGSATVSQFQNLTGTIAAGGFYILAYDYSAGTFLSVFGFAADQLDSTSNGTFGGNGDDTLELLDGTGAVADFYGVQPHADLTSSVWEFEDGRAERAGTAISGTNPPVDADWNTWSDGPGGDVVQTQDAPGDFDPGLWIGTGGNLLPSISNIAHSPSIDITSSTTVSVSADVTDLDGTIDLVRLHWGLSSGSLGTTITMSNGGSGDTWTTTSDIPAQSDGVTVYYEIYSEDDIPESSTSAEFNYTVFDAQTTTIPYLRKFTSDLGNCYTYSVSGVTKEWYWNSGEYAGMNGYNSGDTEEDWLILPGINLDDYTDENMVFDSWYNYGTDDVNNYLKLYYSTDYTGLGDPSSSRANWIELSFNHPSVSLTWTPSGNIDLSGISGSMVYIAFKYHYESGSYRSWGIDEISITDDGPLSVNLSSFYSLYIGGAPTIYWVTQSELNNDYWNVYRGTNDNITEAVHLNASNPVAGNGTTNSASEYVYVDMNPVVQNTTYWYWIEDVSTDGETEVHEPITLYIPYEGTPNTPDAYGLHQNYPNPFNPSTLISFSLEEESDVELIIYNIKGEKIKEYAISSDQTSITWDGMDHNNQPVSSGVYFYKLITDTKEYQKKMLLVK